ncbi:MAG: large subunit ribosomal protein L35 [Candidatus Binatia bacterium]|jgi:large subunit ribosomal protein L35
MRRPKGIKTRKATAKRVKITGTGKILRRRPGRRHLATSKNAKRRRKLNSVASVHKSDYKRILEALPFR